MLLFYYLKKEKLNMCEAFEGLIEEGRKEELKNKQKAAKVQRPLRQ